MSLYQRRRPMDGSCKLLDHCKSVVEWGQISKKTGESPSMYVVDPYLRRDDIEEAFNNFPYFHYCKEYGLISPLSEDATVKCALFPAKSSERRKSRWLWWRSNTICLQRGKAPTFAMDSLVYTLLKSWSFDVLFICFSNQPFNFDDCWQKVKDVLFLCANALNTICIRFS